MKIIIIEDDALIALQIEECVQQLGHEVLATFDAGVPALEFVAENKPDFAFMDIELNGSMDGIQCASHLKNKFSIPSIFVTSHDAAEVIEEAIDLDPLNFLPKPFTNKNIEASLALASKKLNSTPLESTPSSTIEYGGYTFNFEFNTLKHENKIVKLTPKELKLIAILFKNIGNTVSPEEIQTHIWEGSSVSSAAFRKLISRTNEALLELNIASDKGVGYYLETVTL